MSELPAPLQSLRAWPIRATMLRSLLGGFVIGSAALMALAPSQAQVFGGQNSDAPVSVSADHGELLGKQNRAVLAGNVLINQAGQSLRAALTTLAFSSGGGGFKIHRLDATGGVTVTRGNQSATGEVAIYDFDRRIITMAGGVTLHRGADRLTGGRLVIDLTTGLSTIDGNVGGGSSALGSPGAAPRGGRITGTFSVPKRTN
jgi:lipopolysaccharide export system protein LptA